MLPVRPGPVGDGFARFGARRRSRGVSDVVRTRAVRRWTGPIPAARNLLGIVSELRRLNRTITVPLERDLKRAGRPPLECYEVLREIDEGGDVHLRPVELQTRLAIPKHRMSRLIDRLAKDGYVERQNAASEATAALLI